MWERYATTYLPKDLLEDVFGKSTLYRKNHIRVEAPSFVGVYTFVHVLESVQRADVLVFGGNKIKINMVDNKYNENVKSYWATDSDHLEASIYPIISDEENRHFVYLADAIYHDKLLKLGGYLFLDVKIGQDKDLMTLDIDSYFRIKNDFLDVFASSLRAISKSFDNWLEINIAQMTNYITYLGRRVVMSYWNAWSRK